VNTGEGRAPDISPQDLKPMLDEKRDFTPA